MAGKPLILDSKQLTPLFLFVSVLRMNSFHAFNFKLLRFLLTKG